MAGYSAALVSTPAPTPTSAPPRARRFATLAAVAGVLGLALVETGNALLAPALAPTDGEWRAAARTVREGFRPGDLIVAAPAWSDQVMRLHLGDLVPMPVAGRMDDARYGRVWEIAQRGAHAPEARGTVASRAKHGALTVRLWERPPSRVTYDFLERWTDAKVVRREPGGDVPCDRLPSRHQCPTHSWNFVEPKLMEIGGSLRRTLYAQPVGGSTVVIEYPAVPMGRELAFAGGLHHVWLRKGGDGLVTLRVFVDGQKVAEHESGNRTGFRLGRADTSAFAGRTVPVRFEITSDKPFSRHFGFVAEARDP